MKKYLLPLTLALALLAGCQSSAPTQSTEPTPSPAPSAAVSVQPEETPSADLQPEETPSADLQPETPPSAESAPLFQPGAWQGETMYYFFESDGTSGHTSSLTTDMGVGFAYEVEGDEITFHMGSADDNTTAAFVKTDDTHVELTWADGGSETLSFVSSELPELSQVTPAPAA